MSKERSESESQAAGVDGAVGKSLRVTLIVSERTVREYSIFLNHLLVGLADESVPVVLVCPAGCKVDSVWPAVEVLNDIYKARHPCDFIEDNSLTDNSRQ